MDITFLGHSSFRIKTKTAVVITDPFNPEKVGLKFPSQEANIATLSHDHLDHAYSQGVKKVSKVVSGPGEYEIMGVSIIGLASFHDEKKGELRGKNTIYVFEAEGVRLAHLGDLGHKLSEKRLEEMGEINILMIPVGGKYTIDSSVAADVVRSIEPQVAIPMHYGMAGLNPKSFSDLEKVDAFLEKSGLPVERTNKLTFKSADIREEQKIVVLEKK